MWIAKPISALSEREKLEWSQLPQEVPLSQTLAWARGIEAVSGKAYLVFSSDEQVGGFVFATKNPNEGSVHFECINGPLLHWDDPKSAPRQLATFAMAVSKLDRHFKSLRVQPRWETSQTNHRLNLLPLEIFGQTKTATLILTLNKSAEAQLKAFTARMRRTLAITWKQEIQTHSERVTSKVLKEFVPSLVAFGNENKFTVPPLPWFERVMTLDSPDSSVDSKADSRDLPEFYIISCSIASSGRILSKAQILICLLKNRGHYLFGYEERSSSLRSAISTSAAVHWQAIRQCVKAGAQSYDLNGYLVDPEVTHPYYGVCQFKRQFGGEVVQYDSPEILIE